MQPTAADREQPLGGWYLRGDVGVGMQSFADFDFTQTNSAFVWPSSWHHRPEGHPGHHHLRLRRRLRVQQLAARSTSPANIAPRRRSRRPAATPISAPAAAPASTINHGNYSAAVFMANAYIDLGTWWCLTPFIGAGVGGAYNPISGVAGQRHQLRRHRSASAMRPATRPIAIWPGTFRPASPTTSTTTSRSISATAT